MKIALTSSKLNIVGSRSSDTVKVFFNIPQYKLSGPITELWYNFELILSTYVHLIIVYKLYECHSLECFCKFLQRV